MTKFENSSLFDEGMDKSLRAANYFLSQIHVGYVVPVHGSHFYEINGVKSLNSLTCSDVSCFCLSTHESRDYVTLLAHGWNRKLCEGCWGSNCRQMF